MSARRSAPWALDEGVTLFGYDARIRTTSNEAAASIRRIYFAHGTPVPADAPVYDLIVDERRRPAGASLERTGEVLVPNGDAPTVLAMLVWHVLNDAVAAARDLLVVHAGSVVARNERAVLIPAPSGGGKTTLVAALVRAGFGYLSDELAVIDPAGPVVLPVPRAMSVKPPTLALLGMADPPASSDYSLIDGARPIPPGDLGGRAGAAAPVAAVVAPYRGTPGSIEPLSRAAALAALAGNAFNLASFGVERGLTLLRDVVAGASCYELRVDGLDEAAAAVDSIA